MTDIVRPPAPETSGGEPPDGDFAALSVAQSEAQWVNSGGAPGEGSNIHGLLHASSGTPEKSPELEFLKQLLLTHLQASPSAVAVVQALKRATLVSTQINEAPESLVRALMGNLSDLESMARSRDLSRVVDETPVRMRPRTRVEMEERAIEVVLQGAEWLTAREVGERHNPQAGNPHAAVSRWVQTGKIFGIQRAGQALYPSYEFDELGQPIPAVQDVMSVLSGYSPFSMASWFESVSSMLNGRRPREVLTSEPHAVIEAARDHVMGPVHG